MVKKKNKQAAPTARKSTAGKSSFDPESFKYYFPVLLAVMIVGIVLLFKDFLFSDNMLYGSDTINAGLFFRHFYVDYVRSFGSVPLWDPYIFGGLPFIDAFHGDIFYPLSTLKFFGNMYRMLGINLVIHIFLAGIFMYFTARQFRLGRLTSSVSALAYMFSGYLVSLVAPGHDGKIFVTALFPLTMLFLDRAFEKKPFLNFTILGLVIGVIILTPHAQLSYYALWAIALYGAFRLVLLYKETGKIGGLVKPSAFLGWAVLVGVLISAVQFLPGYIYTTEYSPRADTKRGWDWATSWSMHQEEAMSLVVPEFPGNDSTRGQLYWGKNSFKDNSEYAGVIPLFLAIIGVFFYRSRKAIFFGILALFALIYALGATTPIFRIFYYLIPNVKSLRAPATIMFLFLFSVSLLAGMGLQYIIDKSKQFSDTTRKRLHIYLFGATGLLLLGALLFGVAGESILTLYTSIFYSNVQTLVPGGGRWKTALMNLPHIQSGFWIAFLLVGFVAAAIYLFANKKSGRMILFIIPLLIMVDGIRFNSRFVSDYDYRQDTSPNPLTDYLKTLPGHYRVLDLGVFRDDYLPFFDISVVKGYHGNQLRWYDDLLGGPGLTEYKNPNFLDLAGAGYVLGPTDRAQYARLFPDLPLVSIKNFGNVSVYKNEDVIPRAFLVRNYEVERDRKNIYPMVHNGAVDLRNTVVLEKQPDIQLSAPDSLYVDTTGQAAITQYADDSVIVQTNADYNSLLVLTDNWYFAWKAFVDGVEKPVYRADGAFRAVPVEKGQHTVLFKYDDSRNALGELITLLTLSVVAIILVTYLIIYFKTRQKAAVT